LIAKQIERKFKPHLGIYTCHPTTVTAPVESNFHSTTTVN